MRILTKYISENLVLKSVFTTEPYGWVEITSISTNGSFNMITKRTVRTAEAEEIIDRLIRKGYEEV